MQLYTNFIFAQAYGEGTYGQSAYQNGTTTSTTSTGAPNSGTLTNTGFDILLIATLASVLIFAALLVRFWKRPTKSVDPSAK